MLQCIYLQCESARKHVRGYPLGTCTAFSSFKCKACVPEPAETAHFSIVLCVKMLELEFVFGFFSPHENINGLRTRLRETEVSRLYINRTKSVPRSLMVLVIASLIYYPFMY